jgi:hypothetical protein
MSVALMALAIPLRITLSSFHPPVIKYSHKFPGRCFPLHTSTSIPVFSVDRFNLHSLDREQIIPWSKILVLAGTHESTGATGGQSRQGHIKYKRPPQRMAGVCSSSGAEQTYRDRIRIGDHQPVLAMHPIMLNYNNVANLGHLTNNLDAHQSVLPIYLLHKSIKT